MCAFSESKAASVLTPFAAVPDPHLTVVGNDITVPELNKVIGIMAFSPNMRAAQLVSPSLRRMWNFDISNFNRGTLPLYVQAVNEGGTATYDVITGDGYVDLRDNPLELDIAEKLNFFADNGGTAERTNCIVILADAPPTPVKGKIFTVKATSAVTLTAYAWTNAPITFTQTLPAGRYACVGMKAKSTNLIAARAVPVGYTWRPGCIGVKHYHQRGLDVFRYGNLGVLFEFEFDQPPTIDYLAAAADTSQEVWFDLIQVRAGRA